MTKPPDDEDLFAAIDEAMKSGATAETRAPTKSELAEMFRKIAAEPIKPSVWLVTAGTYEYWLKGNE